MNIEDKLLSLFKRVFHISLNKKDDINVNYIEEWDSLSHIKLIMEIERDFSISIDPDKIPHLYSNYNNVLEYIKGKVEN